MILRRTGDALEHSNRINRVLTILIILLALLLAGNLLVILARMNRRTSWTDHEIADIERIEQRIEWYGIHQGLEVSYFGAYGLAGDRAHQERWALSEYYGERFLENAWRRVGDSAEADAAHARAEAWAAKTGSLSTKEAEDALREEVWP